MRSKAIKDLAQLSDESLFLQVAEGLEFIVQNAQQFYTDSERLAMQRRGPSCRVLRTIAEEEAAKYLILIDAIRCPRGSTDFIRQLGRFYDHLARGIYASVAFGQNPTFGDLCDWVDEERKSFFLDGPQGDDYIYRNRILERRESRMYVDYEEYDNKHTWSVPRHDDVALAIDLRGIVPPPLDTVLALRKAGLATAQGLRLLAALWRPVVITDEFTRSELTELNRTTCEAADAQGLSGTRDHGVIDRVIQRWQYPMYSLDMKLIQVSLTELREHQGTSWLAEFDHDESF